MSAYSPIEITDGASAAETFANAEEFRRAATDFEEQKPKGRAWGPYRVLTTQAIELFLNAYLLRYGISHGTLKALGHDFVKRSEIATAIGLSLKQKTRDHLKDLTDRNELVASRYSAADQHKYFSNPTKLGSTLTEISREVGRVFPPPETAK